MNKTSQVLPLQEHTLILFLIHLASTNLLVISSDFPTELSVVCVAMEELDGCLDF